MKTPLRIILKGALTAWLILLSATSTLAQKYNSQLLAEMGEKLKVAVPAAAADSSGYFDCGTFRGKDITIGVSPDGTVNHLGFKFFDPELKTAFPSDVYDFLERYFLELALSDDIYYVEQKVKDDKVKLVKGSLEDYNLISPSVPFSINKVEDAVYQVVWMEDDKELIHILFPVQYELLLGMPKVEIEKKFRKYVEACTVEIADSALLSDMPTTEPIEEEEGLHRSTPSYFYENEMLNTSSYYEESEGGLSLVFSASHRDYSAANLFLTDMAKDKNYRLYMEQRLYGGKKQTFTVSLNQFLQYCKENKLTVYFGVEEERQDGLQALLIVRNPDLGYNHMLSVIIPDNFTEKTDATFKAKVTAFIPTQNVKSLYGKYTPKPKKKI